MAMLKVLGVTGLKSVCDTPKGVRKGALVMAATKTKLFVLRKRASTFDALHAAVDKYRSVLEINPAQWVEIDMATYAITHTFVVKSTGEQIPGTGLSPYDLGPEATKALVLSDDIKLGCAQMNAGYALFPVPVVPVTLDDDVPEVDEVTA